MCQPDPSEAPRGGVVGGAAVHWQLHTHPKKKFNKYDPTPLAIKAIAKKFYYPDQKITNHPTPTTQAATPSVKNLKKTTAQSPHDERINTKRNQETPP